MISQSEQSRLEEAFLDGCSQIHEEREFWIHGSDESDSYCYDCAVKEVKRLKKEDPSGEFCVDGGWGWEGDSQAFCETCHTTLDNSFTDYACESEIEHFLQNGFTICGDDCLSMSKCIDARGWEPFPGRKYRNEDERECDTQYYHNLHRLCRNILDNHFFWIMPDNQYRHMWE